MLSPGCWEMLELPVGSTPAGCVCVEASCVVGADAEVSCAGVFWDALFDEVLFAVVVFGDALAFASGAAGGEAGFEPGERPSVEGGRHAESPSIRTGHSTSPMRCSRDRLFMTAPPLAVLNHAAMCITTVLIILPNRADDQKGSYFPK